MHVPWRTLRRLVFTIAVFSAAVLGPASAPVTALPASYAEYGNAATQTLLHRWFDGGVWRMCSQSGCSTSNQDWGADALTYSLYLRWKTTHDRGLVPAFEALFAKAPAYESCGKGDCTGWSDVPEWDALAALREYAVTGEQGALERAESAYRVVDGNDAYAGGACPAIWYQQPGGGSNKLKTLETDSNAIRVALLLYGATGHGTYLNDAVTHYAAVRRYFLDAAMPLYSVYVFDDGHDCRQLQHRFFASVNGNMMQAGLDLYAATHDQTYLHDAIATGQAVDTALSDGRGVFANLQADNDVAEPLIEAMYGLATDAHQDFARGWLLRNAAAAANARAGDGSFGRFFDGPAPPGPVTAWQTNGGFALMAAAAALAPSALPRDDAAWQGARETVADMRELPARIRFTGTSIALLGTIGDRCCEAGHARVFIDGKETFNRSGIWQNKSCAGIAIDDVVLFAWQFDQSGTHEIRIEPASENAKEGGSYLHLRGYLVN